jgi:hypothetical protein
VHDEFCKLAAVSFSHQVAGKVWATRTAGQFRQRARYPRGRTSGNATRHIAQLNQPLPLQQPAEAHDGGVPFPSLIYVIESPVMQLITAPQRELQIIVLPHRAGRRWPGYRKGPAAGRKYGLVVTKHRG